MKIKQIKICNIVLLIILTIFTFCSNNYVIKAEEVFSAKCMVAIESNTKRILYEKNCYQKCAMASTTKIATAITVLTHCKNIDELVSVSDLALGIEGTSIYLKKDEKLSVKELLYGLILASGNDASVALAVHIGGSIENFVKLMNDFAKDSGANNTNFCNPHGLDANGHYTTAYDIALITAEAMKNEIFKQIISTQTIKISGSSPETYRFLRNKNKLIFTSKNCTGVKTGFTDNAGRCFVGSAKNENMEIITVVFNCGPMFEETEKLFNLCFENYKNYEIIPPYSFQRKIEVIDGREKDVKLYTKNKFVYPLTPDEFSKIEIKYNLPSAVKAPIKKEETVGELFIYLDNHLLFSTKIYTMNSVKTVKTLENLHDIFKVWTKGKNEN